MYRNNSESVRHNTLQSHHPSMQSEAVEQELLSHSNTHYHLILHFNRCDIKYIALAASLKNAHTPLNNTLLDTPLNNTLLDTPLNNTLLDTPLNNTLLNTPLNNTLLDTPLNNTLLDTPLNNTLLDTPLNNVNTTGVCTNQECVLARSVY